MRLEHPGVLPGGLALGHVRLGARALTWAAAAIAGLAVFSVYLATLAPSVMWYDMGEFTVTSATLGIAHNTGYPLLILAGKAFTFLPFGETAWRVNLMSAVFTSLAIMTTFVVIRETMGEHAGSAIGSTIGAAVGATTLAFAATVWANATWATSYGMNLFFTALVARQMLAWWRVRTGGTLVLAALAFGLGMCNHRLIVIIAPSALLLLALGWRTLTPRAIALSAAAMLAGLSVYAYLPVRGEMEPAISWANPATAGTYWSMFLNGQTPADYWSIDLGDRIDILWAYPSFDLTWSGLALAGAGFAVLVARQRAVAAFFGLIVVLTAVVAETYAIHNIYNYLTPGYFALAVLIGVAAAWLCETVTRSAGPDAAIRPHVRLALVAGLLALLPAYLLVRNYGSVDRSGDYTAYDFARTTLDRMPPDAVILTDTWTASPFWYLQLVEGHRKDVLVSPVFSVPSEDPVAFASGYIDHGDKVYVAEGLRVRPGVFEDAFVVQPVVLESIERMVVDSLPRPEYRDDLVMTGTLYSLHKQAPASTVAAVPAGAERAVAFDPGVDLVGLTVDTHAVARGDVAQITYYWRAGRRLDADLSAAALFFDEHGIAAERVGIPVWSQPRDIGQGVVETSDFVPGAIYRESYYSLVPRTLAPGTYEVRLAVFDPAAPNAETASRDLVTVGSITVR